jgi:hypothetical protein
MVVEVKDGKQFNEYIAKNRIVLIALLSPLRASEKGYVMRLLSIIEEESVPTIYTALYLKPSSSKTDVTVAVNLYLDGECIFSQEGLFGHLENDLMALKRGIREVLKNRMVQMKFVKRG